MKWCTGELFGLVPDFFPVDMQGWDLGPMTSGPFSLLMGDLRDRVMSACLQVAVSQTWELPTRIKTGQAVAMAVDILWITPVEFANPLVMDGLLLFSYGKRAAGQPQSGGGTWGRNH